MYHPLGTYQLHYSFHRKRLIPVATVLQVGMVKLSAMRISWRKRLLVTAKRPSGSQRRCS
jgi:hypothetical protein